MSIERNSFKGKNLQETNLLATKMLEVVNFYVGLKRGIVNINPNRHSELLRPSSGILETKNTTFRKLDLFPSSGEGGHLFCWVS
jgi:hypothetical protein